MAIWHVLRSHKCQYSHVTFTDGSSSLHAALDKPPSVLCHFVCRHAINRSKTPTRIHPRQATGPGTGQQPSFLCAAILFAAASLSKTAHPAFVPYHAFCSSTPHCTSPSAMHTTSHCILGTRIQTQAADRAPGTPAPRPPGPGWERSISEPARAAGSRGTGSGCGVGTAAVVHPMEQPGSDGQARGPCAAAAAAANRSTLPAADSARASEPLEKSRPFQPIGAIPLLLPRPGTLNGESAPGTWRRGGRGTWPGPRRRFAGRAPPFPTPAEDPCRHSHMNVNNEEI